MRKKQEISKEKWAHSKNNQMEFLKMKKFEDIIEALNSALLKANENTNSLIVASDFYSKDEKPALNLDAPKNVAENTMRQEFSERKSTRPNLHNIDRNSVKLFNQAYKRKLAVVVEPVFKKYENMLINWR